MPEECHHPDSPLTSGAADAPIPANWRADELLGVRISLTVRLNHIIPIKDLSTANRSRCNSVSSGTRLQVGYLNFSDQTPACDKTFVFCTASILVLAPNRSHIRLIKCRRWSVWSRHYTASRKERVRFLMSALT